MLGCSLSKPALVSDAYLTAAGCGVGDAGWQHALWECHSVHSPEELRAWRPHHCVRVFVLYIGFLMSGATPYLGLTAIESLLEIRI